MSERKFGEIHAKAMRGLGLVELRNAFSFEHSIADDIRRSMYDARRDIEQQPEQDVQQPQEPTHEQQLEPGQER